MVARNILEHPSANKHEIVPSHSVDLDLTDRVAVRARLKRERPDMVIHTAGIVGGIHANIANPVRFMADNLYMGLNVILESIALDVPSLINFGSSCMYPRGQVVGLKEESMLTGELEPTNEGYALSKICSTRLCEYIMREIDGVNYKTLIPCNIYGRFDEFDPSLSHMVPAVIVKLDDAKRAGKETVEIWGDGESRREFIYAAEVADYVFWTIENIAMAPQNVNLGLGYDLSIKEYYHEIAKIVGYEGSFSFDLEKPSGMRRKLCDITKLRETGWEPLNSMQEGLKRTYEYYLTDVRNDL